jgi:hypothetical protein
MRKRGKKKKKTATDDCSYITDEVQSTNLLFWKWSQMVPMSGLFSGSVWKHLNNDVRVREEGKRKKKKKAKATKDVPRHDRRNDHRAVFRDRKSSIVVSDFESSLNWVEVGIRVLSCDDFCDFPAKKGKANQQRQERKK